MRKQGSGHLNQSGVSLTEAVAFLGSVAVFSILFLQLQVAGVLSNRNIEGFKEAKKVMEIRFQRALAFNQNDCPIPELSEEARLFQVNLDPADDESRFPAFDPYYANAVDLNGIKHVEVPIFNSPGKQILASSPSLIEGERYSVNTGHGAFQIVIKGLKFVPTEENGLFLLKASLLRAKDQESVGRSFETVEFPVRSIRKGAEAVCWSTSNTAAESCFQKGGTPGGSNGECRYDSTPSMGRATCETLALSKSIPNTKDSIVACEKGFSHALTGKTRSL